jgi:hypothetical protein
MNLKFEPMERKKIGYKDYEKKVESNLPEVANEEKFE